MKIKEISLIDLTPYEKNPRKNEKAINAVAASIREFGFKQPLVIDENKVIVAGHTRALAAKKLGISTVPCLIASDLTEDQIKAYRIIDNKTAELAEWDSELLSEELETIELDLNQFELDLIRGAENVTESTGAGLYEENEQFALLINCEDEREQQTLFVELEERGIKCKIIL